MSREFAQKCEKFYAAVGATFDKYEEENEEGLDPQVSVAVVAKLYASIGYNLDLNKRELLAYVAEIIDDVYYDEKENDHD